MITQLRRRSGTRLMGRALDRGAERREMTERLARARHRRGDSPDLDRVLAMAADAERLQLWLGLRIHPRPQV